MELESPVGQYRNSEDGTGSKAEKGPMKILTAKVVDGHLDVPEGALNNGDTVTLLVQEEDEDGFHLPAELQAELRAAIEEADRGESLDGWQLLSKSRR